MWYKVHEEYFLVLDGYIYHCWPNGTVIGLGNDFSMQFVNRIDQPYWGDKVIDELYKLLTS